MLERAGEASKGGQLLRRRLLHLLIVRGRPVTGALDRRLPGARAARTVGPGQVVDEGVQMDAAMIVTWHGTIAGREEKALAYAAEVMEFWGRRASEGRSSQPEIFMFENGAGIWMVKGDRDELIKIHDTDEAQLLTVKGELLLDHFHLEFAYAGQSAAAQLALFGQAVKSLL